MIKFQRHTTFNRRFALENRLLTILQGHIKYFSDSYQKLERVTRFEMDSHNASWSSGVLWAQFNVMSTAIPVVGKGLTEPGDGT